MKESLTFLSRVRHRLSVYAVDHPVCKVQHSIAVHFKRKKLLASFVMCNIEINRLSKSYISTLVNLCSDSSFLTLTCNLMQCVILETVMKHTIITAVTPYY